MSVYPCSHVAERDRAAVVDRLRGMPRARRHAGSTCGCASIAATSAAAIRSKNRHATRHFHATGHAVVASLEPDEDWIWCSSRMAARSGRRT